MFKVRGFLDNKLVIDWRMANIPRTGDTVRFYGERYAALATLLDSMAKDTPKSQRSSGAWMKKATRSNE